MARNKLQRSVVIADDHAIVRQGVKQVLGDIPDLSVVAEASDGLSAIQLVKKFQPTMLVVDSAMPMAKVSRQTGLGTDVKEGSFGPSYNHHVHDQET